MKIILTGKPGIGKSTIIQKFRELSSRKIGGIVSREILDSNGIRVGFEAVSISGISKIFAHKEMFLDSKYKIADKYYVDIRAVDDFVVPEIESAAKQKSIVMIDEIGRMQALSKKFLLTVNNILGSDADVLATIVFDPEPWSLQFKKNTKIKFIEVTENNRDEIVKRLLNFFTIPNS